LIRRLAKVPEKQEEHSQLGIKLQTTARYQSPYNILIFDSGVGGLSIYHALIAKFKHDNYPNRYCYFADHQGAPYGDKDDEWLVSRLNKLLVKLNNDMTPDLIVVACNTASTLALDSLREKIHTPIIGVVPAIKTAANIARANQQSHIGLLATPATIARTYIDNLSQQFASDLTLHKVGSTDLVKLAEDKLSNKPIDNDKIADAISSFQQLNCQNVVLGCTHFPLLKEELNEIYPDINWIDSGEAIANRTATLREIFLEAKVIENTLKSSKENKMNNGHLFLASAPISESLMQYLGTIGFKNFSEHSLSS